MNVVTLTGIITTCTIASTLQLTPALAQIKARLEENTGMQFNSVLANLYRDGHDSVAWHADDEPALGRNPVIASISFGDMRAFEMRQRPPSVSARVTVYCSIVVYGVCVMGG